MNNRFTSDAKKVLRYAQESAKSFRHDYVGTEHILLGLVLHTDSMAGQFLAQQGLTSEHVTRAIESAVGIGEKATSALRLTPRTKRTMELAVRTANQLGQQYISTEHMLAGVLQEQGCMARRILEQMDVNPDELLQKIIQLMNNGAAGGEAEGQAIDLSEFGRDLNELAQDDIFEGLNNSAVLVTGATGLIGSEIVLGILAANRIKNLNITVVALVRNYKKAQELVKKYNTASSRSSKLSSRTTT